MVLLGGDEGCHGGKGVGLPRKTVAWLIHTDCWVNNKNKRLENHVQNNKDVWDILDVQTNNKNNQQQKQ